MLRTFLTACLILFLSGCETVQKNYDCGDWNDDKTSWYCISRTTDKCILNTYVEINQCEGITTGSN